MAKGGSAGAGSTGAERVCSNADCGRGHPVPVRFCPFCGSPQSAGASASAAANAAPAAPTSQPVAALPPTSAPAASAARIEAEVTTLQQGANTPVEDAPSHVEIHWTAASSVETDACAFLLGADRRVRSDDDMVFWNQEQTTDGAVRLTTAPGLASFEVRLPALAADVAHLWFCVVTEGAAVGRAGAVSIEVRGPEKRTRFVPDLSDAGESAMVIGELYRRAGGWRFRAVAQGYVNGLGPLAKSLGVDVEG